MKKHLCMASMCAIMIASLFVFASCEPETKTIPVESVILNKYTLTLEVGATETLTATVKPDNATNKKVSWSSDKPAMATVDTEGKVSALTAGKITITAMSDDGVKTAACELTITDSRQSNVPVTGVVLEKHSLKLVVGATEKLRVNVQPETATDKRVEWKSSDESVATVDDEGEVTALTIGTTVITVRTMDGGKIDDCNVTVEDGEIPVTGVTLDRETLTLAVGENVTLVPTVMPKNAANKTVTWKSDNSTVASVDADGKVTAMTAGNAKITVTTVDGAKESTCDVTVIAERVPQDKEVTNVLVSKSNLFLEKGATYKLTAKAYPLNATNSRLTWKTDKPNIATVNSNGLVTAKAPGTAIITAADSGFFQSDGSCYVTVVESTAPPANEQGEIGSLTWSYSDETLTINGTGTIPDYSINGAPWSKFNNHTKRVAIGNGVNGIGNCAFANHYAMKSVTISTSVESIGTEAFYNCNELTDITLPSRLQVISVGCFAECSSLTRITIPNGVTKIEPLAFTGCMSLTEITIPGSVTSPIEAVFLACFNLRSVTLPATIPEIGLQCFDECYSLTSITIPNSVTKIGDRAFSRTGLTAITVPESVVYMGKDVFYICQDLMDVTLLSRVELLKNGCFRRCVDLINITLPANLKTIEKWCFGDCRSISSVTLPAAVTMIGDECFCNTFELTTVTCKAANPPTLGINNFPIDGDTLHVPAGSKSAYESNAAWKEAFTTIKAIP